MKSDNLEGLLLTLRDTLNALGGIGVLLMYFFIFVVAHTALVPSGGVDAPVPERSGEGVLLLKFMKYGNES